MTGVRLKGEHVMLRPIHTEELDRIVAAVLSVWVAFGESPERVRDGLRERVERSGEMSAIGLDLAIDADGRLAGDIQARHDGLPKGAFEVGIAVFDEADRRRGWGTEALRLLTSYLFETEAAHRVQLSTDVANVAMRRSAERAGFSFEGTLRGFWPEPGGSRDYAMYGITKHDYEEAGSMWI